MGMFGSLFSGDKGLGFQASGTNIAQPQTSEDVLKAQQQAQQMQAQQAAFANALQAQGQQGMGTQAALTGQLQQVASGQGPNPATAQLAQATGQNVANQNAMMAGQRGASQNVGQIARQAAQQGAATQQQAVGQAATLQAQQAIAAQQQLAQLAQGQIGQQQNALGLAGNTALSQQQLQQQQLQSQNANNVAMQSNINSTNAGMAQTVAQKQGDMFSGLMNAAGSIAGNIIAPGIGGAVGGALGSAIGGGGGMTEGNTLGQGAGPSLFKAKGGLIPHPFLQGFRAFQQMAKGGEITNEKVPAMVSPGEVYLPPNKVNEVAKGKDPASVGEKIPGKAKVGGDSYKNDTVKRVLEAGGVVIPRHIMSSKNPAAAAAKFVQETLAKQRKGSK